MATYNSDPDMLAQQLESLLAQQVLPDEIIVRDDCSNNGTTNRVEYFSKHSPVPINLIRSTTNLGYSKNFTEALRYATGRYIFYCDQDDVWLPHKIKVMLKAFQSERRPLVVIHDQKRTNANLVEQSGTTLELYLRSGYTEQQFVHGCATAFDALLLPLALDLAAAFSMTANSSRILN